MRKTGFMPADSMNILEEVATLLERVDWVDLIRTFPTVDPDDTTALNELEILKATSLYVIALRSAPASATSPKKWTAGFDDTDHQSYEVFLERGDGVRRSIADVNNQTTALSCAYLAEMVIEIVRVLNREGTGEPGAQS